MPDEMEQSLSDLGDVVLQSEQSPDDPEGARRANARFWLAAIVDSSDDAIIGKGLDGVVTSWNKGAEIMFGYTADEMVGQPIAAIIPPDRLDEEISILKRLRLGERVVHFETTRRRKDGGMIPISLTVSPIRDDQGRLIGASKIARDCSDRDGRERRLRSGRDVAEQANQAKSRFLASMSHELRTPLNGILGYAHLLRLEGGLNCVQSARVDAMLGAGTHLLEMIEDILSLSEIETGHLKTHVTEVEPCQIAGACLDAVRPSAEAKGLVLGLAAAPRVPSLVRTDALRLRQVLLNLLGNAVKFTEHGKIELRVRLAADSSTLRIEVADTGPGIPASQRHLLFEHFERLDTEATRKAQGAGLGLALSAQLANLLGGRLGHDENPDGGSVFWLELPIDAAAEPPQAAAVVPTLPITEPAEARPLSVLVVDDVAMNRDIAGSFLRAAGHKVACVEGGAEAVAAAETMELDVVVMDVRMPKMDGLEATRRIRALGGVRGQVPIVALTAQAFAEQVEECRKAGMSSHVSKPFDPDTLVAAVVRAATKEPQGNGFRRQSTPTSRQPSPVMGSNLPVLEPRVFERTVAFLSPNAVSSYLQNICELGEALLHMIHRPDGSERTRSQLSEAAHTLAGTAGMFGFERLTMISRRFEQALESDASEAPALADGLSAAVTATLKELHSRRSPTGGP
jgi:PAS domain S-box-containing protein